MKKYLKNIVSLFAVISAMQIGSATTYKQLTNLPAIYIETFDHQAVTSETVYKLCKIIYVTPDQGTLTFDSVKIRGRGNTTWTLDKKPYRIKFPQKTKLLGTGYAKAKDWVLLANAGDKLLMRNGLTSYIGQLMNMDFVPACQFTDLYLNGAYRGTYQITDQMEVHKKRVDIVEQDTAVTNTTTNISGGYFLEPEGLTASDGLYFDTNNGCHIRIHSPDPDVINSRQISYIKNFINRFETVLYGTSFTNKYFGYQQYVDTTSLISWYLANEICANPDGFWCSFIYKERDNNHIFFGPLWDFDICYNNCSRQGDVTNKLAINFGYGSSMTIKGWYTRFWDDPWFKTAVCSHFNQLRANGLDSLMYHYVDSVSDLIEASRIENYKIWSLNTKIYDEEYLFNTYDEYVDNIKSFIKNHNNYLTGEFTRRVGLLPTKPFSASTDSYYKLYSKAFPNKVIAPDDTITGKPSSIGLHTSNEGSNAQLWNIYLQDGHYVIVNVKSGLALSDTGSSDNNMQLKADTLNYALNNQKWILVPQSVGGYYNLKNVATGNVANNYDGMADEGNPIYVSTSSDLNTTSANRMWKTATYDKPTISAINDAQADVDYALAYSPSAHTLRFVCNDLSQLVFQARIYNLEGQWVATFRSDETFDAANLPGGTYIVSWVFAGQQHSTKFLKN
jgi:hypothetical protein